MTDRGALIALVERLGGARVLCVGDVMLDRFVYGAVERISPEAPIPVLKIGRETEMLGGAGNVVRNLVALGASPRFVSAIGADGPGERIRALLAEEAAVEAELIVVDGRRTSVKSRFLAGNQQLMRADDETQAPLEGEGVGRLVDAATRALAECDVIVLSDYGKGVLCREALADILKAAKSRSKPVIVDPKGTDFSGYRGASVLTPNRRELGEATRMAVDDDAAVVEAAHKLVSDCAADAVLVTRSREGMTLVSAEGAVTHLAAEAREVFDVSGAGDTVAAALAAAIAAGAQLDEAAALANVAAGIVVGKIGTAVAFSGDVAHALHHQDLSDAEAKVSALAPALESIERWRQHSQRIGFTNGVFDLLHPGHVTLLRHTRAFCDRLVVGLNSDSSVKRLKGADRPLQSEAARATVLASLASVDMVVIFTEETPLALIEAIRPDVLVKGADYALEDVVGADVVQGYGGRVELAPVEPGYSTSATIARMAK